jgi:hypothetical protein
MSKLDGGRLILHSSRMVKGSCGVGCGRSLLDKAETLSVEKNLACDQYWLGSTKWSATWLFLM